MNRLIDNASSVLKYIYLPILRDQLNKEVDPVISKIKQTSDNVWGKEIIKQIEIDNKTFCVISDLKNFYGRIEISEKAIRASENNTCAFVNLLNSEIEDLLKDTKRKIINGFYNESNFSPVEKENQAYPSEIYKFESFEFSILRDLFDINNETLYGVNRKDNKEINPIIISIDSFNPLLLQEVIDNNNEEINIIICSNKTKRDYQAYLLEHKQDIKTVRINSKDYILFNNEIPIIPEKIPDNVIYLINTNDFTFHQLYDWLWLNDEDGNIIRQDLSHLSYYATLVKYGAFMCSQPNKQIKVEIK